MGMGISWRLVAEGWGEVQGSRVMVILVSFCFQDLVK